MVSKYVVKNGIIWTRQNQCAKFWLVLANPKWHNLNYYSFYCSLSVPCQHASFINLKPSFSLKHQQKTTKNILIKIKENKAINLKSPDAVHRHLKCGALSEHICFTSIKCYKITSVRKNTVQSVILFVKRGDGKRKLCVVKFVAYTVCCTFPTCVQDKITELI